MGLVIFIGSQEVVVVIFFTIAPGVLQFLKLLGRLLRGQFLFQPLTGSGNLSGAVFFVFPQG